MKKHVDTFVILGVLLSAVFWTNNRMDTNFEMIEKRFDEKFESVASRLTSLETRLTRIETVLVMQKIMPQDFVLNEEKE